ncbi:carbamoyl phosphate synthase small subunit [Candidatus Vidania fulgoroideorum]
MHYKKKCYLRFEDGKTFKLFSYGKKKNFYGKITFNNSNLGYQEIITDPSYYNNIILFLSSNIGNTGVNFKDNESIRVFSSGIIVNKYRDYYSNYRSVKSLKHILKVNNSLLLETNRTREIFEKIKKGYNKINIYFKKLKKNLKKKIFFNFNYVNYSYSKFNIYKKKVLVIDLGLKENILRILDEKKIFSLVITKDYINNKINIKNFDGVLITNGPGDPRENKKIIDYAKYLINIKKPIMGICLGHQIISLAMGKKIFLDYIGQHGSNYPVKFFDKNIITTQNHNYYIKNKSKYIYNLKDNKNQGFFKKNIITFQGHPESCPGTKDSEFIFDYFIKML